MSREIQPSALPAEFAERVSDPVDAAAWERARRRYELPRRDAMKIKHVRLDLSRHILVVDGTRGPVAYGSAPATHPSGYARFLSDAYGIPDAIRGRLLQVSSPETCFEERVPEPIAATEAYETFSRICKELADATLREWPEATP